MRTSLMLLFVGLLTVPLVTPVAPAQKQLPIIFYDPLHNTGLLKDALSAVIAYEVSTPTNTVNKEALLITTVFDDQVRRHLQSGGRAIVLCNSLDAFPEGAPFKVKARDESTEMKSGGSGIKTDSGPFAGLDNGEHNKKGIEAVEFKFVITNVRGEIGQDAFIRVDSTEQSPGPIVAMQMYAAGGRVFVTTFQLERYGENPWARWLLNAIIAYTTGPNFSPKYDWHIREE